jgi:hypothetical protein
MRAGDVVVTSVRVAVAGADAPLVVAVATVPSRRPSGAPWRAGAADTPQPVGVAR